MEEEEKKKKKEKRKNMKMEGKKNSAWERKMKRERGK